MARAGPGERVPPAPCAPSRRYGGNPGSGAADDQSAHSLLRQRLKKCHTAWARPGNAWSEERDERVHGRLGAIFGRVARGALLRRCPGDGRRGSVRPAVGVRAVTAAVALVVVVAAVVTAAAVAAAVVVAAALRVTVQQFGAEPLDPARTLGRDLQLLAVLGREGPLAVGEAGRDRPAVQLGPPLALGVFLAVLRPDRTSRRPVRWWCPSGPGPSPARRSPPEGPRARAPDRATAWASSPRRRATRSVAVRVSPPPRRRTRGEGCRRRTASAAGRCPPRPRHRRAHSPRRAPRYRTARAGAAARRTRRTARGRGVPSRARRPPRRPPCSCERPPARRPHPAFHRPRDGRGPPACPLRRGPGTAARPVHGRARPTVLTGSPRNSCSAAFLSSHSYRSSAITCPSASAAANASHRRVP